MSLGADSEVTEPTPQKGIHHFAANASLVDAV